MDILNVNKEDARELLAIYEPYVKDTAISFEYDVPDEGEFQNRILHISEKYPYLKAVEEGKILGYAYAGSFKDRSAYDWSVETSIYVHRDCKRMGVGKTLYKALEEQLVEMGILNMNACIASPIGTSRYVNEDSIHFHEKMGFHMVGKFHQSGYKFGEWFDMVWMEKMIGSHDVPVKAVTFGNEKQIKGGIDI